MNGRAILAIEGAAANAVLFASPKFSVAIACDSTKAMRLGGLNNTPIDLSPHAANITLPDGSVITGQTTFEYVDASGQTEDRTQTDETLQTEAMGYRVEHVETVDGAGTRTQTTTGHGVEGSVAFVYEFERPADGSQVENRYDDNGDGVVNWLLGFTVISINGRDSKVALSSETITTIPK